jgi:hypothetical protein
MVDLAMRMVAVLCLVFSVSVNAKALPDSLMYVSPILQNDALSVEWSNAINELYSEDNEAVLYLQNYAYFTEYLAADVSGNQAKDALALFYAVYSYNCTKNKDARPYTDTKGLILHSADRHRTYLERTNKAMKSKFSPIYNQILCNIAPAQLFIGFDQITKDQALDILNSRLESKR